MRRTLLIVLVIVTTFYNAGAQKQPLDDQAKGIDQINIASKEVKKVFTPPYVEISRLKSASAAGNFKVTYENFPEDAKKAFEYAVTIWESIISSPVPINIHAKWEPLNSNMLAQGKPTQFYKNFDGAFVSKVYFPVALAEKLSGKEMNGAGEPDISCTFNQKIAWYFGTDGNTPSNKYDFVTAVLHELTHGLGFSGFFNVEDETGYLDNSSNLPSIYDYLIYNIGDQRISNKEIFSSPSNELFQQFISEKLKFYTSENFQNLNSIPPAIYAPENWKNGSSLYHLDSQNPDSEENSLMTAYKFKGEAVHTPGNIAIEMLSEMGWRTISFDFDVVKDFEESCEKLPINVVINGEIPFDSSTVKVIFSKDYFTTVNSLPLTYNTSTMEFSGDLPINNHLGNIQYYFEVETKDGKTHSFPGCAPEKKFSFRIGPDYSPPSLKHNPIKVVSKASNNINLKAIAHDNIGVKSVKVEYVVDGIAQEPIDMKLESEDAFSGTINIPEQFLNSNKIEYRIIADDKSKNGNKITVPANGYFSVEVFEPVDAVKSYQTNFDMNTNDFISADFEISGLSGFSSGILHTQNPYPISALEKEKYNLIAQLKYPIIIENGGQMSFDEVVLVEPGETDAKYTDLLFWDYVIVEGSKDGGKTWLPLTEGYDSNSNDNWYSSFINSVNSNSLVTGNEKMFINHTINLTGNSFNEGDTVIFRFRLSSDQSVNGWGWAIDNLNIQTKSATTEIVSSNESIDVYPNPVADNLFIDCSKVDDVSTIEIMVTDLTGKTVFRESWQDPIYSTKKQINLANIKPGIYLVNMVTDASQVITEKIVKY